MKVLVPPFTTFTFVFIPRRYAFGALSFEVINERTNLSLVQSQTVTQSNGYITAILDLNGLTIKDNDSLTIKVSDVDGTIYRGKIYASDASNLQDFTLLEVNQNVINL